MTFCLLKHVQFTSNSSGLSPSLFTNIIYHLWPCSCHSVLCFLEYDFYNYYSSTSLHIAPSFRLLLVSQTVLPMYYRKPIVLLLDVSVPTKSNLLLFPPNLICRTEIQNMTSFFLLYYPEITLTHMKHTIESYEWKLCMII